MFERTFLTLVLAPGTIESDREDPHMQVFRICVPHKAGPKGELTGLQKDVLFLQDKKVTELSLQLNRAEAYKNVHYNGLAQAFTDAVTAASEPEDEEDDDIDNDDDEDDFCDKPPAKKAKKSDDGRVYSVPLVTSVSAKEFDPFLRRNFTTQPLRINHETDRYVVIILARDETDVASDSE